MANTIELLAKCLEDACKSNGSTVLHATGSAAYRYEDGRISMPDGDAPYIYVVVAGEMRLHTPSGIMDYVAGQYSASAIDTPRMADVKADQNTGSFLSLSVEVSLSDVIEVVLSMEDDLPSRILDGELCEEDMKIADASLLDTCLGLVRIQNDSPQSRFLAKHLTRELAFHALCGTNGAAFLKGMVGMRKFSEIYELNSWIKENFRERFTVEELAEKFNMSPSALHVKFKSAVGMGPLQCQKRLRLTEARRLMLDEGRNVTEAAFEVGYESSSQFTRDYKNMFGVPPKEDIIALKA